MVEMVLAYGTTKAEFSWKHKTRTYVTNWRQLQIDKLKAIIDSYPDLYLDETQEKLYEANGGWWSTPTIWRKLTTKIGYLLQVATDKSFVANEEEQQKYQKALEELVIRPDQLIYVDESQKDRNSSRRRRLWSKQGLTSFRPAYLPSADGKRYSLLAACDVDGFLAEACETVLQSMGQNDTDMSRGTIDTDRFNMWVVEKLIPVLGRYDRAEPQSIVMMDNATIHDDVVPLIEAAGAKLIFTAPYSLELNPIELCFGSYKKSLRRLRNKPHWLAHTKSLRVVTPEISRAFFRHWKVPLCQDFLSEQEIAIQNKASIESFNFTIHCASIVLLLDAKRRQIAAAAAAAQKRRRLLEDDNDSNGDSNGDGLDNSGI